MTGMTVTMTSPKRAGSAAAQRFNATSSWGVYSASIFQD
jgi:hypothetical protein